MRILFVLCDSSPQVDWLSESIHRILSTENQPAQIEEQSSLPTTDDLTDTDLVIVGLDSPDQYSADEVEQILSASPLTRWICVTGPWSESDGRNRATWPFAVRVPWQRFPTRFLQEVAIYQDRLSPLPLTASRNECFQFEPQTARANASTSDSNHANTLLITDDPALEEYYRKLLQRAGFTVQSERFTIWAENFPDYHSMKGICLIDLDPWNKQRINLLQEWKRATSSGTKWIGLTNEINPEVITSMKHQGLSNVIPKLMGEAELLQELQTTRATVHP
ncbi:MAG: hypothetical protein KDA65_12060 [Planctomycetaceae bacterium]|nr:hypothetical protein [Planctomycetaceae bacterium]